MSSTFYEKNVALNSRDLLFLTFRLKSPLHIGERQEGTTKKILFFKVNGKDVPIIPAESFKGAFRSLATKLAKSLFEGFEIYDVVNCHGKDVHVKGKDCEKLKEKYKEVAKSWLSKELGISENKIGELSETKRVEMYLSFKCPICRLFGSGELASKTIFFDVIFNAIPEVGVYTSTSIDRKTKVVAEERLFQIEYIPPEGRYELSTKIIVDNVEKGSNEAIVLATTLEYMLENGLLVGGSKSRGYGLLEVDNSKSYSLMLSLNPNVNLSEGDKIMNNVNALLLKETATKKLGIPEYCKYLKGELQA